jgi:hypothetical protein
MPRTNKLECLSLVIFPGLRARQQPALKLSPFTVPSSQCRWHHGTQYNETQNNNNNATLRIHSATSVIMLSVVMLNAVYVECCVFHRYTSIIMLNVNILSVVMLNVVK